MAIDVAAKTIEKAAAPQARRRTASVRMQGKLMALAVDTMASDAAAI